MKLLITGAKGQLGSELVRLGSSHELFAVDYDQLDITDANAVINCINNFKPDAVINAAAYTAVDRAESDVEAAFAVNRDGPTNLARACGQSDIPLIHVSTDYVFDGSAQRAYIESDTVSPLGVYGQSKLAGEDAVRNLCRKHLILRTSWVFSPHGNNFVKTMLRLGAEREGLGVVADQFGKPTSAAEIARLILETLPAAEGKWGTYHLAQPDRISWFGFAEAIFSEARRQGMELKVREVNAISTSDYPTPAKRPSNSELNCERLESVFGVSIRPWQKSLAEVIKELKNV
ncbi:dTDP-4-dehydrorhamnose reductase [Mariprofundus ferrinatatus]|uniref:dTDP-4-dehydrorhamnose reductase n=1 Tax=Mariprofundus ferrinatatus TaxID=1921087 RepID=A0A2K8L271_9PROT|nr:dTDP-4-dehydrorhamnose reductase [Mariprofundus ferrinatatus]ATX81415.1 dTDP-4-dehydrorhamnose reductase [Mariprofundus ferrinatatus]